MPERKPVTRKPSWLGGILLPCLAGIPTAYLLEDTAGAVAGWYVLSAWQIICGLAMIFERAPVYAATSIPQAGRLCELYGFNWLAMGFLTIVAARELPHSLATSVLAASLVCTFGFSIAAGPTRLVNANDKEMYLVPTNSFLVAWTAASLYIANSKE
jgi:hypothetical protein